MKSREIRERIKAKAARRNAELMAEWVNNPWVKMKAEANSNRAAYDEVVAKLDGLLRFHSRVSRLLDKLEGK